MTRISNNNYLAITNSTRVNFHCPNIIYNKIVSFHWQPQTVPKCPGHCALLKGDNTQSNGTLDTMNGCVIMGT